MTYPPFVSTHRFPGKTSNSFATGTQQASRVSTPEEIGFYGVKRPCLSSCCKKSRLVYGPNGGDRIRSIPSKRRSLNTVVPPAWRILRIPTFFKYLSLDDKYFIDRSDPQYLSSRNRSPDHTNHSSRPDRSRPVTDDQQRNGSDRLLVESHTTLQRRDWCGPPTPTTTAPFFSPNMTV